MLGLDGKHPCPVQMSPFLTTAGMISDGKPVQN
jgi:hypothetical protein